MEGIIQKPKTNRTNQTRYHELSPNANKKSARILHARVRSRIRISTVMVTACKFIHKKSRLMLLPDQIIYNFCHTESRPGQNAFRIDRVKC